MPSKIDAKQTLDELLASCSETLFPAEFGDAPVYLNTRDVNGDTPLHVMSWRGDTNAAIQFIAAGADVNAVGDMSETPLHVAIRNQDLPLAEALLNAGADANCVSEFGETPRAMAKRIGGLMGRLFEKA